MKELCTIVIHQILSRWSQQKRGGNNSPAPLKSPSLCLSIISLTEGLEVCRDVRFCGARAGPLQWLEHPLPVLEGPCAQKREGETGVQEALLRGGLARHRQQQRSRGGHVHLQPLQTGPTDSSEGQLQPERTQQWGETNTNANLLLSIRLFYDVICNDFNFLNMKKV